MEVPCVSSLNMNNAFRTEGYHIEEYLLSMGLDKRLGIAKEGGSERDPNRSYFGCGIKNSHEQLSRATSAIHARAQQCIEAEGVNDVSKNTSSHKKINSQRSRSGRPHGLRGSPWDCRKRCTRRIDKIAKSPGTSADIIDPTESRANQPEVVNTEKTGICTLTIPHYKDKYNLSIITVQGLLIGARCIGIRQAKLSAQKPADVTVSRRCHMLPFPACSHAYCREVRGV
ncbi:hypothetical protein ANN_12979 [Periplaneta americana]|uniref:Uncharacterized protein n=1 Tax=Periplaneta americana TaxID=6978 RepID=A0ABQ8TK90_PERAM|nr:hypothetical protein ANN_12979 [Periplaneta americana]